MFKLVYGLNDIGEYKTFPEAFKALYELLTKDIQKGIPRQMLSTIFIEKEIDGVDGIVNFDGAGKLAIAVGLLKEDGKLQDVSLSPIIEKIIEIAFISGRVESMLEAQEIMEEMNRIKEEHPEIFKEESSSPTPAP